jgi:hypothetical protein
MALLKDARKDISRKLSIPEKFLFSNATLEAMTLSLPDSIEELALLPGIGEQKAKSYGNRILDIIAGAR